jgi:hypothetical protein
MRRIDTYYFYQTNKTSYKPYGRGKKWYMVAGTYICGSKPFGFKLRNKGTWHHFAIEYPEFVPRKRNQLLTKE